MRVHLWIYDLEEDRLLEEIALKSRPAPFMGCTHILPGEDRLVVNPIIDGKQRIWTMDLDGSEPREITCAEDGFVYCVQISPDGRRFAYHSTMLEAGTAIAYSYRTWTEGTRGSRCGARTPVLRSHVVAGREVADLPGLPLSR